MSDAFYFIIKLEQYTKNIENESIVVHCNKGVTGNAAQNVLINLGFSDVYNLSGGYKEYKTETIFY